METGSTDVVGDCSRSTLDPDAASHTHFRDDAYWQTIPAFADVDPDTFHTHTFQDRNSVTSLARLKETLGDRVDDAFYADVEAGLQRAPMSIRISPHLLGLIDWDDPYSDPIRTQFLPVGSRQVDDHPELHLDSLNEQEDSPVPGLTHRYPDRALFLALNTCPVYCRFCTRSYAVGLDTEQVEKVRLSINRKRWEDVFAYVAEHPEVEDLVVSGGDVYNLRPEHIREIGERLLAIDHVRRFRYASKGPAVAPQKLLSDTEWVDALTDVVEQGRRLHKEVVLHTHFNHPNEMTSATQKAMNLLMERGVTVRNQAVLQRGVNDDPRTMQLLLKRLSYLNVTPYYVFFHDLVQGVEDLRTPLWSGLELEKQVRGVTAGFNTPTFIVDTFGGGGKRDAYSFEHYDRETGIAVYLSPSVRPGQHFFYFDPIDTLSDDVQARWRDTDSRREMMESALRGAGAFD